MQSPAAAVGGRSTQAAGAAAAVAAGLKTFSRRYPSLSTVSRQAVPVSSHSLAAGEGGGDEEENRSLADGKLNFRVRKRRQQDPDAVVAKGSDLVSHGLPGEGLVAVVTNSHVQGDGEHVSAATVISSHTDGTRRSARQIGRLRRGAGEQSLREAQSSLGVVQQPLNQSNLGRRAARKSAGNTLAKQPLVGKSTVEEPHVDFWHSSLADKPAAPIAKDLAEDALVGKILLGKNLSTPENIAEALEHLKSVDPLLKVVIEAHDGPVFEKSTSAFTSLGRSIVFQQLSTKSAAAIFGRLITLCEGLDNFTPTTLSQLSAQQLRTIGISGRKAEYLHDLSANFLSGVLSDSSITTMDDEALMKALTAVKGIGMWSVHMFMLFSLHRPDVLPVSDLGVRKGFQSLYKLKELPGPAQIEQIASVWQPYRSIGSWYMWRVINNTFAKQVTNQTE